MENQNHNERTLAYKTACLIERDELTEVGGGATNSANFFTTKQTVDNMRNWDVGSDIVW
jgi:phage host-nuclease inhibitor protein Gam